MAGAGMQQSVTVFGSWLALAQGACLCKRQPFEAVCSRICDASTACCH